MGFFSSTVASLEVDFYNDSMFDVDCFVKYDGSLSGEKLFLYFILYYKRISFNLNKYDVLMEKLTNELKSLGSNLNKNYDAFGQHYFKLLETQKSNYTTRCSADFKSNNAVVTKFYGSSVEMFAALSIRAFLQYIINTLSEDDLKNFALALFMAFKDMPGY